jgi:hypothetical protein
MFWGCAGDDGGGSEPEPQATWTLVAEELPAAALSVHGASANDVWVAGADVGQGPLVLHWNGEAWTQHKAAARGDLWWVHAAPGGKVYFAGTDSTILQYDGSAFTRMKTPGVAKHTVFGVWARSATEIYAAGSINGRDGFLWRSDGAEWTAVEVGALPLDANGNAPGFFKVWGDADELWLAGGNGLLMRQQGSGAFEIVPTGTTETILTVHAADGRFSAVGGGSTGLLLEAGAEGIVDSTPEGAPVLQGLCLDDRGDWATGYQGEVFSRTASGWQRQETGLEFDVQSLHAVWVDPDGGVWSVGGNVLTQALDGGAVLYRGPEIAAFVPEDSEEGGETPELVCPEAQIDPAADKSMARRWNEATLNAIRRSVPRPTVHARNLFHVSVAMYDAWAAYDDVAKGYVYTDKHTADDLDAARDEAISYAAYRVAQHRYATEVQGPLNTVCFDAFMAKLGLDPADNTLEGDSPRAVGNRIGKAVVDAFRNDGANEANDYKDTTGYEFVNDALVVDQPGTTLAVPEKWQPLNLAVAETQNGLVAEAGLQGYIGPHWKEVTPFALERPAPGAPYFDLDEYWPVFDDSIVPDVVELIEKQAQLDHTNGKTIDISPGKYGNNPIASNGGTGHPVNPATGAAYAPNVVPLGDFGRVMAEFWADGPKSETPPGHWNTLANKIADAPAFERRVHGEGEPLSALEWDVKAYFTVNGATHDAAIVAWEQKRISNGARPISLIRHMAGLGQSSDPEGPMYHAMGLPLIPGLIELITEESAAPGERHAHLASYVGQIAILAWPTEPGDRANEYAEIQWIRGEDWIPYQRRTFVTPAFPGFTSGHSTFSRSAAKALDLFTGSPYFPGGLMEFTAKKDEYLVFENGPSVDVRLQWATYYDAADQAGQSRIWGGIHITADDFGGRMSGEEIGESAYEKARKYFEGTAE